MQKGRKETGRREDAKEVVKCEVVAGLPTTTGTSTQNKINVITSTPRKRKIMNCLHSTLSVL
jgi:hypothetical protein